MVEPTAAQGGLNGAGTGLDLSSGFAGWGTIFDAVPDLILVIDSHHRIIYANKAMADRLKMSPSEALGKACHACVHGQDTPPAFCPHSALLADHKPHSAEVHEDLLGGDFLVTVSPVLDKDGTLLGSIHICTDITERKKAEAELKASKEYAEKLLNTTNAMIVGLDENAIITSFNDTAEKISGYGRDEVLGKSWFDTLVPKSRYPLVWQEFLRLKTSNPDPRNRASTFENPIITKSGEERHILWTNTTLDTKYSTEKLVSFGQDITEMKNTENELKAARDRFRVMFDCAPDIYYIHDLMGNIIDGNRVAEQRLGYSRDELLGKNLMTAGILTAQDIAVVAQGLIDVKSGKTFGPTQLRLRQKDGSLLPIEAVSVPVTLDGRLVVLGIARDISERKKAEGLLKAAEEKFRKAFESNPSIVGLTTLSDGKYVDINENFTKELGWAKEEVVGHTFLELGIYWDPADRQRMVDILGRDGRVNDLELRVRTKNGEMRFLEFNAELVDISGEKLLMVQAKDITSTKKAKEELQLSESKFRLMFDSAPDLYILHDLDWVILDTNKATQDTLGYGREALVGKNLVELGIMAPEEARPMMQETELLRQGRPFGPALVNVMHKEGRKIILEVRAVPITLDGKTVGMGIARDITNYRKSEEELRWKTALLEAQINSTQDGILIVDSNGTKIIQNRRCIDLWKIPDEIIANKDDSQQLQFVKDRTLYPDKFVEKVVYLYSHPDEISQDEVEFKDGMILERYSAPIKGVDGTNFGRIWMFHDITERRMSEEAIKESKAMLQNIINLVPIRIFWKDSNLRYLGCNTSFAQDAGKKSPDELIGKDDFQMGWKDQAEAYREDDLEVMRSGKAKLDYEEPQTTPEGDQIWLTTNKLPLKDLAGRISGLLGTYMDITSRKNAEQELKDSEFALMESQRVSNTGSYELDVAKGSWKSSRVLDSIFGIDTGYDKNILGWANIVYPEDKDEMAKYLKHHVIEQRNRFDREYRIVRRDDGRVRWVYGLGELKIGEHGEVVSMIGTIQDITERKIAEQKVKENETFVNSILENIPNMIFVKEAKDLRFVRLNKEGERIFGASKAEIYGKNDFDFFPKEQAEFFTGKDRAVLAAGKLFDIPEEPIDSKKLGKRLLHTMKIPILDESGRPLYLLGISEDITEKRQAEKALKAVEQRLRDVLYSSSDFIWEVDPRGLYTFVSGDVKKILGYDSGELIGKSPFDLMPPDEAKRIGAVFGAIIGNKGPIKELENLNVAKDGRQVWLITSGVPILGESGELLGYRGVDKDITERKASQLEIIKRTSELERFNRLAVDRELRMVELKRQVKSLVEDIARLKGGKSS